MKKYFVFIAVLIFCVFIKGEDMKEPVAKKIPHKLEIHNDVRIDNYFWLKNRDAKDVIDYLKLENKYTEFKMKDTKKLQKDLYKELLLRIKEDDQTPLFKYKDYEYFKKFLKGKEYPIYLRKNLDTKKEEILVDVNKVGKGKEYCHFTQLQPSPDQNFIAFAVDFKGRRFYSVYIKDLKTGKMLDRKIENITSNFVWDNESKKIYYVKQDSETLRWDSVWVYDIEKNENKKIYFEDDETFSVSVSKSNSEDYIFIDITSTLTTEVRYLKLSENYFEPKIFRKREKGLEYSIEDGRDCFYILHNKDAKNFKISKVKKNSDYSDMNLWEEVMGHRDDVLIEGFEVFKDYLVISERKEGLINFRIIDRKTGNFKYIKFNDEDYSASSYYNMEYNSQFFRYTYESMITPPMIYDYNLYNDEKIILKKKEIPNYVQNLYEAKRVWIKARDGENVPVSLVYKKDSKKDKLYIYGYGSYGYSIDCDFNSTIFPMVDRGFVYAIAHIRGGSELGRRWYEDGRQLKKKNTFYDFIDATKALVDMGYGSLGHIYAEGGSAGGLLMGAISNMANDLYSGIIAEVPFVDVLTTMLDKSIPLTTGEFDEWGNPEIKEYYDYIKTYSPYDNVEKKCYPNMLVTTGYNDSQVQYWEPAKWVAKLRDYNTCKDKLILLKADMSTGHSGKSGRYEYLKDIAFNYAFVMKVENLEVQKNR